MATKTVREILTSGLEDPNLSRAERRRIARYIAARERLSPVCTRAFTLAIELRDTLEEVAEAMASAKARPIEHFPGEGGSVAEDLTAFATVINGYLIPLLDCQTPVDCELKLKGR